MAHTHSHDDYFDKLHRLAAHIKAHPEEAKAGVLKLSAAAQKPAGEIVKIFASDKDDKTKFEEIHAIKDALPASVRAEIDEHKTQLAHKIGILTLEEIVVRLDKLAEYIRAHPEEAKAGVLKLSTAAQQPAGEIVKIFAAADKDSKTKFEECRKILDSVAPEVRGEINAHKEQLAKRLRIVPLHHLSHIPSYDDYVDKVHRLIDHIKAHPDEARAGVAKLSAAAQQPAGDIIKIFVSDKDAFVKLSEIQKIKAGLTPAVRAEIEEHKTQLAHKIGILTLKEIHARLQKLAEHIKEHPEEARAGVAKLTVPAQKPAGDIIKIFVSDQTVGEKHLAIQNILDSVPPEVRGEIQAHKEQLAKKLRITPLHHLGQTHAHEEYIDKIHRLAEHIKAHPDEARAGVAKLSEAAQKPAGEIIKIFVSDKDSWVKISEIQKIKAALPAAVAAEIEAHKAELAHKIGILTIHEILERLEKLAEHIKAHPEEARAGVAKLSAAAQQPAGDIIKIFVSNKTPKEKREDCQAILHALPAEVRGEIQAAKDELAIKIGVAPLHHA